jgi:Fe-S cluster assembly scaffold protein SufB
MCEMHDPKLNGAASAVAEIPKPTFKYGRDIGFTEMADAIAERKRVHGSPFSVSSMITVSGDMDVVIEDVMSEIRVVVPAGMKVVLTERVRCMVGVSDTPAPYVESRVRIDVGPGAEVCYVIPAAKHGDAMVLVQRTAEVAGNAKMTWYDEGAGAAFAQSWMTTNLRGEHAQVEVRTAVALSDAERADLHTHITHHAPKTTSRIVTRVVVADTAKAVSRDVVVVEKGMFGSDVVQESKVLLLSPKASCHAVPQLEIATDKVAAKHSASITRVEDTQLFALMSRGVSREEAQAMIVEGFLNDVRYAK